ncbi:hypothetical protein [Ruminococcus albus]|uniref:Uncharacterized protein n=1 Tax=Ruminococcus albus TaxID=1264 RepID=A0A1H7NG52_RUMAL|nr:hypothetical protein [Ruminococcus albus]SEL22463.1 hypothetical protein SAMN05216469_11533 [Ruminococcus albus]
MVSKKGKRRIVYDDRVYYWFVRVTEESHRINIISEDKKIRICAPFRDTEESVTPGMVRELLEKHFADQKAETEI